MAEINKLRAGYEQFYDEYFIKRPEVYEKLVKYGQTPKTLVIACSDSRVDPSIILNTEPGDIFVIRNVANLVPPSENAADGYHGTSAAIQYAVENLKVENIIILGHSCCGGIAALVSDEENDHSFIENWLYILEPAKQKANEICTCCGGDIHEICEREAIKISLANLLSFDFVRNAVVKNELELHGWYFHLETGKLEVIGL